MIERKPVIAVDLDDVISLEREAIRVFANERLGLSLSPKDYDVEGEYWGYWEQVWGIGKEAGGELFEEYKLSGAWRTHQPMPGAIEALNILKKDHDLAIITSRADLEGTMSMDWLREHFPGIFKRVEFVRLWGESRQVTKAIICNAIGAEWLIDDHFNHCTLAAEAGIEALLFGDYGWNRNLEVPAGVTRVKDWPAVLEYFNAKS